jgi:hypothetical protein
MSRMWRIGARTFWAILFIVGCGSDGDAPASGSGGARASAGGSSVEAGAGAATGGGAGASNGGAGLSNGGAGNAPDGGGRGGATGGGGNAAGRDAGAGGSSGDSGRAAGGTANGGTDGGVAGSRDAGTGGVLPLQTTKLDLLIVVDNSSSMTDKQEVLAKAVPDLVNRLANPALGIEDMHVGVVTSSLGGHGANTCTTGDNDDRGHLLATLPRGTSLNLPAGFASWARPATTDTLVANVQGMITAVGEAGCGLEATLESMYRFLIDPKPSASVTLSTCPGGTGSCATPTGVDSELLAERPAFLRPDSAIAIVLISDENDCSIIDGGQNYYAADLDVFLPKAAAVCDQNPNDPCCHSCATAGPSSCPADPTCQGPPSWNAVGDPPNLRCFAEKRRFGIDFLYPVERYINALTRQTLCLSRLDLDSTKPCPPLGGDAGSAIVGNPLFTTIPLEGLPRNPTMVYLLGIVGVPWQTIRVTKDSAGNLLGPDTLVYPSNDALVPLWPVILGNPTASPPINPTDPLMIESVDPRTGVTPGTGEALAPPSAGYLANSVNGHEGAILKRDDLQHACIFHLDVSHVCTDYACDCYSLPTGENNPVCQAGDGSYGSIQYFGRAYPGLRHLSVIKGLGAQAAAASICAKNLTDVTRRDYGYRPAIDALMVELDRSIR